MKLFKGKLTLILLTVIIILGFALRWNNLYTWPRQGATFDEYAWTWQGISIIKTGIPTSWSFHPQYKIRHEIRYQKTPFVIVTPYLEHPPVFGLVAGSFALLSGAKDMYHVNLHNIRGLALILGTISIFLVFLLGRELYDEKIGLFSALLYATIPTIVIGSRIVQNENFFIPVWLVVLFLTSKYIKTKNVWLRNLAALLCGLLMLAKVPWVAAAFSVCVIFIFYRRYSDIAKFLAIVIPLFLLYFVYGFYYDKDIFLRLWGLQLNRYDIGFNSIFALFQKPYLADRFYTDGWILWGWVTFIIVCLKDLKKNIFLISAVLSYFIIFLAAIPDEAGHGWYRYPFYPFLILSVAIFLKDYFSKNFVLTFLFLVFIGTSLFEVTWAPTFGFSYVVFRLAIIGWGLTLIPAYLPQKNISKFAKIISYAWFGIFILMNIWSVLIYNEM